MDTTVKAQGRCLCHRVSVMAQKLKPHVDACHCGTCRKWGGGPLMSIQAGADVVLEGQEHIQVYESSEWAERGFCKCCGTHLFYRIKDGAEYYLPAGLFDELDGLDFTAQIFIDRKPAYYNFAEKTLMLTEAEVHALFAPKG